MAEGAWGVPSSCFYIWYNTGASSSIRCLITSPTNGAGLDCPFAAALVVGHSMQGAFRDSKCKGSWGWGQELKVGHTLCESSASLLNRKVGREKEEWGGVEE